MNILITGAGSVMGQSIYKALAMHDFGEAVQIHFANSDPLGAGRYFALPNAPIVSAPIFPLAVDADYVTHLAHYVDENAIDIVFSGTQHELAKLAAFRDRTLKAATIPAATADICMDKIKTAAVLARHGVRVPQTQTLDQYLEGGLDGPVVVKPNYSSSSRKIFRLKDRQEAARLVAEGEMTTNGEFLVQELLEGGSTPVGVTWTDIRSRFSTSRSNER